uniref:PHD finger protein ALFIN-LIKE n=1 Tax=Chenopodium quinoa TaxID=63459 RepID=A0A803LUD1_CHEQI
MANLEQVFTNWQGRRAGLLKALTTEADDLYEKCDPEKLNLCLYGKPNGEWEVSLPSECLPPKLPDPTLGINFARDGIAKKVNWLKLVAVHSNAWLLSVAFHEGASSGFDKVDSDILDERLVLCDICEAWFHAKCVNMTPTVADDDHPPEKYTCQSCKDEPPHQCSESCVKIFGKCVVV